MDQGKPDVALNSFYYALIHKSAPAALANAAALAEGGRIEEAIIAWDTISRRKDSTQQKIAESMKRVLGAPPSWFPGLTDNEKSGYAQYRIPLYDSALFVRSVNQISDENLRAKTILHRSIQYLKQDEVASAAREFRHLQGLHLTNHQLFIKIKYFELRLMASRGLTKQLQDQIKQGIIFGPYLQTERVYYDALAQEVLGDTLAASKSYEWLARNNPYFDDGVVAAANYFLHRKGNLIKSYRILSDALQVNPHAVRILKAYIIVAQARGFDQFVEGALETLSGQISPAAFP